MQSKASKVSSWVHNGTEDTAALTHNGPVNVQYVISLMMGVSENSLKWASGALLKQLVDTSCDEAG